MTDFAEDIRFSDPVFNPLGHLLPSEADAERFLIFGTSHSRQPGVDPGVR
jgi:hypothetical protein